MIYTQEKETISGTDISATNDSFQSNPNDQEESPVSKTNSPIIGVLGAKGGVGTTTIALNLAAALSLGHARTTIIDANLQQPEVAHLTGRNVLHTISELLVRKTNVDKQLFDACVIELGDSNSKLNLLSPPLNGEAGFKFNLTDLSNCINELHSYSDFWVIDLPRHLDKHLVTLTDICEKIVLVFEATVQGVATCKHWLGIFQELGYSKEKIVCVLNRSGSKYRSVEQQMFDCFTGETIFRLPNAFSTMCESSTHGTPVVLAHPSHVYSKAMIKLAQYLGDATSHV
jgi:pilus assembly protein CpaE